MSRNGLLEKTHNYVVLDRTGANPYTTYQIAILNDKKGSPIQAFILNMHIKENGERSYSLEVVGNQGAGNILALDIEALNKKLADTNIVIHGGTITEDCPDTAALVMGKILDDALGVMVSGEPEARDRALRGYMRTHPLTMPKISDSADEASSASYKQSVEAHIVAVKPTKSFHANVLEESIAAAKASKPMTPDQAIKSTFDVFKRRSIMSKYVATMLTRFISRPVERMSTPLYAYQEPDSRTK